MCQSPLMMWTLLWTNNIWANIWFSGPGPYGTTIILRDHYNTGPLIWVHYNMGPLQYWTTIIWGPLQYGTTTIRDHYNTVCGMQHHIIVHHFRVIEMWNKHIFLADPLDCLRSETNLLLNWANVPKYCWQVLHALPLWGKTWMFCW